MGLINKTLCTVHSAVPISYSLSYDWVAARALSARQAALDSFVGHTDSFQIFAYYTLVC